MDAEGGVQSLDLEESVWCEGCRKLKKEVNRLQEEHTINYQTLKQKIISTDLLIRKYRTKCEEYDVQNKRLEEQSRRLDRSQLDCEMLETQLKASLQSTEPLKQARMELETKLKTKNTEIQKLQNSLEGAEMMRKQYEALIAANDVMSKEEDRNKLDKKIQNLESNNSRYVNQLRSNKEELKCLKSDLTRSSKNYKKLESKLSRTLTKLEKYWSILKENDLLPQGDKKPCRIKLLGDTPWETSQEEESEGEKTAGALELCEEEINNNTSPVGDADDSNDVDQGSDGDDDVEDSNDDFDDVDVPSVEFCFTFSPICAPVSPLPPSPAPRKTVKHSTSPDDNEDSVDVMATNLQSQLLEDSSDSVTKFVRRSPRLQDKADSSIFSSGDEQHSTAEKKSKQTKQKFQTRAAARKGFEKSIKPSQQLQNKLDFTEKEDSGFDFDDIVPDVSESEEEAETAELGTEKHRTARKGSAPFLVEHLMETLHRSETMECLQSADKDDKADEEISQNQSSKITNKVSSDSQSDICIAESTSVKHNGVKTVTVKAVAGKSSVVTKSPVSGPESSSCITRSLSQPADSDSKDSVPLSPHPKSVVDKMGFLTPPLPKSKRLRAASPRKENQIAEVMSKQPTRKRTVSLPSDLSDLDSVVLRRSPRSRSNEEQIASPPMSLKSRSLSESNLNKKRNPGSSVNSSLVRVLRSRSIKQSVESSPTTEIRTRRRTSINSDNNEDKSNSMMVCGGHNNVNIGNIDAFVVSEEPEVKRDKQTADTCEEDRERHAAMDVQETTPGEHVQSPGKADREDERVTVNEMTASTEQEHQQKTPDSKSRPDVSHDSELASSESDIFIENRDSDILPQSQKRISRSGSKGLSVTKEQRSVAKAVISSDSDSETCINTKKKQPRKSEANKKCAVTKSVRKFTLSSDSDSSSDVNPNKARATQRKSVIESSSESDQDGEDVKLKVSSGIMSSDSDDESVKLSVKGETGVAKEEADEAVLSPDKSSFSDQGNEPTDLQKTNSRKPFQNKSVTNKKRRVAVKRVRERVNKNTQKFTSKEFISTESDTESDINGEPDNKTVHRTSPDNKTAHRTSADKERVFQVKEIKETESVNTRRTAVRDPAGEEAPGGRKLRGRLRRSAGKQGSSLEIGKKCPLRASAYPKLSASFIQGATLVPGANLEKVETVEGKSMSEADLDSRKVQSSSSESDSVKCLNSEQTLVSSSDPQTKTITSVDLESKKVIDTDSEARKNNCVDSEAKRASDSETQNVTFVTEEANSDTSALPLKDNSHRLGEAKKSTATSQSVTRTRGRPSRQRHVPLETDKAFVDIILERRRITRSASDGSSSEARKSDGESNNTKSQVSVPKRTEMFLERIKSSTKNLKSGNTSGKGNIPLLKSSAKLEDTGPSSDGVLDKAQTTKQTLSSASEIESIGGVRQSDSAANSVSESDVQTSDMDTIQVFVYQDEVNSTASESLVSSPVKSVKLDTLNLQESPVKESGLVSMKDKNEQIVSQSADSGPGSENATLNQTGPKQTEDKTSGPAVSNLQTEYGTNDSERLQSKTAVHVHGDVAEQTASRMPRTPGQLRRTSAVSESDKLHECTKSVSSSTNTATDNNVADQSGEADTNSPLPADGEDQTGQTARSPAIQSNGEDQTGQTARSPAIQSNGEDQTGQTARSPAIQSNGEDQTGQTAGSPAIQSNGEDQNGQMARSPALQSNGEDQTGERARSPAIQSNGEDQTGERARSPAIQSNGEDQTGERARSPAIQSNGEDQTGEMARSPAIQSNGEDQTGERARSPAIQSNGEDQTGERARSPAIQSNGEDRTGERARSPAIQSNGEDQTGERDRSPAIQSNALSEETIISTAAHGNEKKIHKEETEIHKITTPVFKSNKSKSEQSELKSSHTSDAKDDGDVNLMKDSLDSCGEPLATCVSDSQVKEDGQERNSSQCELVENLAVNIELPKEISDQTRDKEEVGSSEDSEDPGETDFGGVMKKVHQTQQKGKKRVVMKRQSSFDHEEGHASDEEKEPPQGEKKTKCELHKKRKNFVTRNSKGKADNYDLRSKFQSTESNKTDLKEKDSSRNETKMLVDMSEEGTKLEELAGDEEENAGSDEDSDDAGRRKRVETQHSFGFSVTSSEPTQSTEGSSLLDSLNLIPELEECEEDAENLTEDGADSQSILSELGCLDPDRVASPEIVSLTQKSSFTSISALIRDEFSNFPSTSSPLPPSPMNFLRIHAPVSPLPSSPSRSQESPTSPDCTLTPELSELPTETKKKSSKKLKKKAEQKAAVEETGFTKLAPLDETISVISGPQKRIARAPRTQSDLPRFGANLSTTTTVKPKAVYSRGNSGDNVTSWLRSGTPEMSLAKQQLAKRQQNQQKKEKKTRKRKSSESEAVPLKKQVPLTPSTETSSTAVDRELDVYLNSGDCQPDSFLQKLVEKQDINTVAMEIFRAAVKVLQMTKIDQLPLVVSVCSNGSSENEETFLTDMETRLLDLITSIMEKYEECPRHQLMEMLWNAIFLSWTSSTGRSALCRIFTALCRYEGDMEQVRVFIFKLLTCGYLQFVEPVLAVVSVWPLTLRAGPDPCPMIQVIRHVILNTCQSETATDSTRKLVPCFQTLCEWSPLTESSIQLLATVIDKLKLYTGGGQGDACIFETMKSVELLVWMHGWKFIYVNFINRHLTSVTDAWNAKGDNSNVNLKYAMCMIRILGNIYNLPRLEQKHKEFAKALKRCLISTLEKPTEHKELPMCCAEVLAELSPLHPHFIMDVLSQWFKKNRSVVPAPTRMKLEETRKFLSSRISAFSVDAFI